MKKSTRISAYVETLGAGANCDFDPHYVGFFTCFNRSEYYEAHDVLEHLWLRTDGADRAFFQGLIQIAGAFVHLRKQFLRPDHPKDGQRLRPAARLFTLGMRNIAPFAPVHHRLDVNALTTLCEKTLAVLVSGHFKNNPWHPSTAPFVQLLGME
jgi:Domain of unknown function (DUF309)